MEEYKPKENEIAVYTVAVGGFPKFPWFNKGVYEAIKLIKEQEGFIGMHPVRGRGNLLLFDTENNAKGARNMLRFRGIDCGSNICKVYIDRKYLKHDKSN